MTLPTPSDDRGLTKLHLGTPKPPKGLLVRESVLKTWEGKVQRAITKLHYGDELRAVAALTELKDEIAATRKGVS